MNKTIYICYSDKTKIPKYIYTIWKKLNPEYNIKLYGNKECYNFLIKYFSKDYADFFDNIKDGPIKADFWRVCILYIYGGVYVDIDVIPIYPLRNFISDEIDFLTSISIDGGLNPLIIYSKPNNILLYNTILALYNNKNKEYSYWGYSICGAMKHELKKLYFIEYNKKLEWKEDEYKLDKSMYRFITESDDRKTTSYKGEILFQNHNPMYKHHTF